MQFVENHRAKPMDILIYMRFSFQILKSLENHGENHVTFLKSLAKNHVGFIVVESNRTNLLTLGLNSFKIQTLDTNRRY